MHNKLKKVGPKKERSKLTALFILSIRQIMRYHQLIRILTQSQSYH